MLHSTQTYYCSTFYRKLSEAVEGTGISCHVLGCIFCGKPCKQGGAKTATENNSAQKGEDSDSNQVWFEPALLQSTSFPLKMPDEN